MNRLVAVRLAIASLALTSVGSGVAAHAADPAAAPVIEWTGISTETGGLSGHLPIACTVRAEFTDESPSDPDRYAMSAAGMEGHGATPQYDDGEPVPGAFSIGVPCGGLTDGDHEVVIREHAADGTVTAESQPATFSFRVIGHPSRIGLNASKVRGGFGLYSGRRYRLNARGPWEEGAVISTQVWTSKASTAFTSEDWTANTTGRAAVVSVDRADAMVTTFKIPRRLAGRWAWISVLGRTGAWGADGVADYRYTWAPIKILRPQR